MKNDYMVFNGRTSSLVEVANKVSDKTLESYSRKLSGKEIR